MKTFVVGDIHGAYKALRQVIERSKINYQKDRLICLGDVADSWPEVPECFDQLLQFKHLVYILGNHDEWLYQYLQFGATSHLWTSQGGQATLDAYIRRYNTTIGTASVKKHLKLLKSAHLFYIYKNKLFVHGGFNWHKPIEENLKAELIWDRHMFQTALMWRKQKSNFFKDFDEVFVGHTATNSPYIMTQAFGGPTLEPVHVTNLWNLDQGAGWGGKLTLMDVDTHQYWQSDLVNELYPNVKGR